ncbi:MAB_1171c family putative transporter [Nocardia sp. CWNU-33]|uniref:MAB_1171c family putative transporter n=1 Tax=Nocardia sp. CWNU-33 TaxID=3392117 RepID=UPI00398EDC00
MYRPAPTWLVILGVAAVCGVAVARWILLHDTVANRLINRALAWLSIAMFIAQAGFACGAHAVAHLIFLAVCPLTLANLYGLARLFGGADPTIAEHRQWRYDLTAALAGCVVVLIGLPEDHTWPGFWLPAIVYWTIFNLPTVAAGILLTRACLRELRIQRGVREVFAYGGLLTLAIGWFYAAALSLLQLGDRVAPVGPAAQWGALSCGFGLLVATVTAVPLLNLGLVRLGLDRTGRDLRALHPLWRDLTDTMPEIALRSADTGQLEPSTRLYRMIVEIRDALLHLRQYAPPEIRHENASISDYARLLAHAANEKAGGAVPSGSAPAFGVFHAVGGDLSTDIGHLLALSREWQRASVAVRDHGVPSR